MNVWNSTTILAIESLAKKMSTDAEQAVEIQDRLRDALADHEEMCTVLGEPAEDGFDWEEAFAELVAEDDDDVSHARAGTPSRSRVAEDDPGYLRSYDDDDDGAAAAAAATRFQLPPVAPTTEPVSAHERKRRTDRVHRDVGAYAASGALQDQTVHSRRPRFSAGPVSEKSRRAVPG